MLLSDIESVFNFWGLGKSLRKSTLVNSPSRTVKCSKIGEFIFNRVNLSHITCNSIKLGQLYKFKLLKSNPSPSLTIFNFGLFPKVKTIILFLAILDCAYFFEDL